MLIAALMLVSAQQVATPVPPYGEPLTSVPAGPFGELPRNVPNDPQLKRDQVEAVLAHLDGLVARANALGSPRGQAIAADVLALRRSVEGMAANGIQRRERNYLSRHLSRVERELRAAS